LVINLAELLQVTYLISLFNSPKIGIKDDFSFNKGLSKALNI